MKKIVIATTDETINDETKNQIGMLADKYDGEISGVIHYPKMFILNEAEIMAEAIKKVKADYVFFTGYDCLLSEIKTNCRLSDKMDKENIKLINVNTANEIRKAIEEMPVDVIDFLKGNGDQENDRIDYKEDSVMVICNENTDKKKLAMSNDELTMGDVSAIANLTLARFSKDICKDINGIIDNLNINHIVILNDIDSVEFNDYIDSLKQIGIKVLRRDQQEYSDMCMITNMGLN